MVATRVLISLCMAGLTVAAPQLDLPGVQRTVTTVAVNDVNEDTLVNDVVSALEPSIALAVANALRSLQTRTTTVSDGALIGGGASSGLSSTSSFSASAAAKSSSAAAKTSSISAAAEKAAFEREFSAGQANEEVTTRPEYNFEFKVADGEEQTYITQQETRDGDELTGSYSYVDPEGSLITVNYQAGPMGFSQTTEKKENFIQIIPRPPRITASSLSGATSGSSSSSSSGSKFTSTTSGASTAGGASFSSQTASNTASSSLDQSALIAQILAALQPQITASVNAALTSSQSRTTSSVIAVPAAPVVLAARPSQAAAARPSQAAAARPSPAAAGGNIASLFGDGYAVRISTPEFKIEY